MRNTKKKPVCNENIVEPREYLHILYENTIDGQLTVLWRNDLEDEGEEFSYEMNWSQEDCEQFCDVFDELIKRIYSAATSEDALELFKSYLRGEKLALRAISLVPRCHKLKELGAPDLIMRNEAGRLAEALAINWFTKENAEEKPEGLTEEEIKQLYEKYRDAMEKMRED